MLQTGMDGVDMEKVKRIVHEMSKDSPFYKEQERRDARVTEQIAACRERLARIGAPDLQAHTQRADRLLAEIDGRRSLERTWACVDMDAFFAACEALEDPSLRGDVVFAVGGVGMISTASYAARRYGVRSAMRRAWSAVAEVADGGPLQPLGRQPVQAARWLCFVGA